MKNDLLSPNGSSPNLHGLTKQNYIQQVSIDCVIFGYQNKQLKVLIPKLNFRGDFFALPSGFIDQDEDIDQAATRILQNRTGIRDIYLEQFKVFGKAGRNSAEFIDRLVELNSALLGEKRKEQADYEWFTRRFISIGYYALVDINQVIPQKTDLDQSIEWYDVKQLPPMIMDHTQIIKKALLSLRNDLDEKLIAYKLLPETFTMKEVQQLYETIFDKPFAANNFPKMILEQNVLERLEKKYTGAANKAPYLYRFKQHPSPAEEFVTV